MNLLNTIFCLAALASLAVAGGLEPIHLPTPQTSGGVPLMRALSHRHTSRSFSTKPLPLQTLSNLLWAAFGINRPGEGKRTAPSAYNHQEVDIYVLTARGVYLYNAAKQTLEPVLAGDIRALGGTQEFVKDAPLTLVYVADFTKMGDEPEKEKIFYSAADTGFIGQNVYLFCASEGLATGVRGSVDRPTLSRKIGRRPSQQIILAQSASYPGK